MIIKSVAMMTFIIVVYLCSFVANEASRRSNGEPTDSRAQESTEEYRGYTSGYARYQADEW